MENKKEIALHCVFRCDDAIALSQNGNIVYLERKDKKSKTERDASWWRDVVTLLVWMIGRGEMDVANVACNDECCARHRQCPENTETCQL